jgi:uncharacterized protein (TIGR00255 family)
MTGYGKVSAQSGTKTITLEIRSLNSKQIDINTRMPLIYKDREMEIRNVIVKKIQRGKTDMFLTVEDSRADSAVAINQPVVKSYLKQIQQIAGEMNIPISEALLATALRLPDTLKTDSSLIPEDEWKVVLKCLNDSLEQFDKFRCQEGAALEKDFKSRIGLIEKTMDEIKKFEEQRIVKVKERLQKALTELMNNESFDKNRLEQELIFYLEKLDITEEKVRLKNHCEYFYKTMKEENPGRKLGFISQEIGREINTIGSKANDSDIQKLVVVMKDELEKVKEQLLNVL